MISQKKIEEFKKYLISGGWEEDFGYMSKDGQDEMLDLLDSIFELCELADKILTKKLYKNMMGTAHLNQDLNDKSKT